MKRLAFSLLLCMIAAGASFAQTDASAARTTSPKTSPVDEYTTKFSKLNKSPSEFVATLAEFINKFPYSERATSYFFSVRTVLKNAKDADETRNLANQLIKETGQIPAAARMEAYRDIGTALYTQGLYEDSAAVARKVIGLFDEAAYMEFKKKQNDFP